ncbi:MAG: type II/IV secretion system ATPase subunit [Candidatus Pacearchaeota archaeon]|nr:MAG: type II/IV secretion system ATPase subunit [Candidatus Pacearchaeota archaeon]
MIFKPETKLYAYEITREAGQDVMYINYLGAPYVPTIADSPIVMARTVESIIESPNVSRVVFVQQRNYSYDFRQVSLLVEVGQLYVHLIKQVKVLETSTLEPYKYKKYLPQRYDTMRYLVLTLLKQDPLACYVEAKRLLREERIIAKKLPKAEQTSEMHYIRLLTKILSLLEGLTIIKIVKERLLGHKVGDRTLYKEIFRPEIVPNFTFTRLMSSFPPESEIIDQYDIGPEYDKSTITILKIPGKTKDIYHIMAPEFTLSEELQSLVNMARNVLLEHKPRAEEFVDPSRIRQVFFNIARDLIRELAETKKISLSYRQINKLAVILVRHTIGFGLVEVLLQDDKIQDIMINAPIGIVPIFIRHQEFDECNTNIIPSHEDAESWAAKFRMISGRALDEANPVLDTELIIGAARARVSIIQKPLSPYGLAYAIRRHREKPWTLPLFIQNRMINPMTAGVLSFLIDGGRTLIIAGTRSSGKTSMLGACMLEIMPRYRVIVIEGTMELPVNSLRDLGYDILRMKVREALARETTEMSAAEGIRTSLRLGDSSLIVGEVRSEEALALYEAMRIGALANVVAGTIHGASPYGVFDRVVNDLKVPATSFKATDIILICNPIKSPDGLHRWRRVLQLAEIRKHWISDPSIEHGFLDLFRYDVRKDELIPTDDLINGESEILKDIAGNVKGWAGSWDAVWDNILLRAKIKEAMVKTAKKIKRPQLLEAPWVLKANNMFHNISDKVRQDIGVPQGRQVFKEWQDWLKKELKKKKI